MRLITKKIHKSRWTQEDLTQDLSAAGRSYSGSVGRRKILLRICRPPKDLTQDLSAAGRSYSGSVGRRKILLRICRPPKDLTSARKLIILELLAELKKPKRNTIAKTRKNSPIMRYNCKSAKGS